MAMANNRMRNLHGCRGSVAGGRTWMQPPTLTSDNRLPRLEVDLGSDLNVPRLQNQRRTLPPVQRIVGAESRGNRLPVIRVEQVVDIERQADAGLARSRERL